MHSLSPEDWTRLDSAMDQVLDLPPAERASALQGLLGDAPALLQQALRWAGAVDHSEDFLEPSRAEEDRPFRFEPGDQVGDWTIRSTLAQGGTAEVYRAQRQHADFVQDGALKLLKHSGFGKLFRRERQLLNRLQHPHIAHFLDGGLSEAGQAYTVIAFVDGLDLGRWCQEHRPSLEQRLQLFLKLCAAVSHAHGQLVVHRDIKPGNVMVDAAGEPKLLDFGIGRLLEPGSSQDTTQLPFTPSYAAPEQIERAPVTVATDVYGLGGLLHFLLVERAPWGLDRASLPQVIERVLGEAPPNLLDPAFASSSPFARRLLQGDLQAILRKAMRRDPAQRYSSVEALAADIRAHLEHRPVSAQPEGALYQARRFLRRNLWQSVAAGIAFLALGAGLIGSQYQARQIAQERDLALRSADRAHAVRSQLFSLLKAAEGGTASQDQGSLFEAALADIRRVYADEPAEAAALLAGFGQLYFLGNDYVRAEPLLREALDLAGDSPSAALIEARLDLAQVLFRVGHNEEAALHLQQAQQKMEQRPQHFRLDLIESRNLQSQLLRAQGQPEEALALLESSFQQLLPYAGEDSTLTAVLATNLATAYLHAGRTAEALDHFAYGWGVWESSGQAESPDALNLLNNWGLAAMRSGSLDLAVQRLEQAHALRDSLFGPSAAMAALKKNLAEALWHSGRKEQALPMMQSAEAMAAEFVGQQSPLHLGIGTYLAEFQYRLGQFRSALQTLSRCWADDVQAPGLYLARARSLRAASQMALKPQQDQAAAFEQALAEAQGPAASAMPVQAFVRELWALSLERGQQDQAAEQQWQAALELRIQAQGEEHWQTQQTRARLNTAPSSAGSL